MKKNKCDSFCRDYVKKYNASMKKLFKHVGKPYTPRDKFSECKKMYCNESCRGSKGQEFLQGSFHKRYKTKKVKELKKKGALSGCVYDLMLP